MNTCTMGFVNSRENQKRGILEITPFRPRPFRPNGFSRAISSRAVSSLHGRFVPRDIWSQAVSSQNCHLVPYNISYPAVSSHGYLVPDHLVPRTFSPYFRCPRPFGPMAISSQSGHFVPNYSLIGPFGPTA